MIDSALARLQAARQLDSPELVSEFVSALDQLPMPLTSEMAEALLSIFDDSTSSHDVMFDLIHQIEKSGFGVEESAVASGIAGLLQRSPWWAEVIVMRLLNYAPSRELLSESAKAKPESRDALARLLAQIGQGNEDVARFAREGLVQLQSP